MVSMDEQAGKGRAGVGLTVCILCAPTEPLPVVAAVRIPAPVQKLLGLKVRGFFSDLQFLITPVLGRTEKKNASYDNQITRSLYAEWGGLGVQLAYMSQQWDR